eukprot:7263-Heterococcus_DN1.PRE.3
MRQVVGHRIAAYNLRLQASLCQAGAALALFSQILQDSWWTGCWHERSDPGKRVRLLLFEALLRSHEVLIIGVEDRGCQYRASDCLAATLCAQRQRSALGDTACSSPTMTRTARHRAQLQFRRQQLWCQSEGGCACGPILCTGAVRCFKRGEAGVSRRVLPFFAMHDAQQLSLHCTALHNCSPAADSYQETMGTLRYVERAKDIANSARIKEGSGSSSISSAAELTTDLREAELQWRTDCGALAREAAKERAAAAATAAVRLQLLAVQLHTCIDNARAYAHHESRCCGQMRELELCEVQQQYDAMIGGVAAVAKALSAYKSMVHVVRVAVRAAKGSTYTGTEAYSVRNDRHCKDFCHKQHAVLRHELSADVYMIYTYDITIALQVTSVLAAAAMALADNAALKLELVSVSNRCKQKLPTCEHTSSKQCALRLQLLRRLLTVQRCAQLESSSSRQLQQQR